MKKGIRYIVFAFLLVYSVNAFSTNPDDVFLSANEAYAAGEYERAVELYEELVSMEYQYFALYYNLGNAYFKSNQIAPAILYYEKALELNPSHNDVIFNLNVANTRIVDKIDKVPEFFIWKWWRAFYNAFPMDIWALTGLVLFILSLVSLMVYFLTSSLIIQKAGFWLALILFFFSLISLNNARIQNRRIAKQDTAIVYSPVVTVKSSPSQESVDLFVLHEGSKVYIKEELNEWYRIRIDNGSEGWIKGEKIRLI